MIAQGAGRLDPQHLVGSRRARAARRLLLVRGREGRAQHAHEATRDGVGAARNPRERDLADLRTNGPGRRHARETRAFYEPLVARIPLGRIAEPEDLLGAALFFCSDASAFVTGQILTLDGGLTACQ